MLCLLNTRFFTSEVPTVHQRWWAHNPGPGIELAGKGAHPLYYI
jgi:hypothetical protein